jgi:hypothetical protein
VNAQLGASQESQRYGQRQWGGAKIQLAAAACNSPARHLAVLCAAWCHFVTIENAVFVAIDRSKCGSRKHACKAHCGRDANTRDQLPAETPGGREQGRALCEDYEHCAGQELHGVCVCVCVLQKECRFG